MWLRLLHLEVRALRLKSLVVAYGMEDAAHASTSEPYSGF
jgi:hypothetical protein